MITGIDHVQITIPPQSEELARAFYCRLLGLPEIDKPASLKERGGFWLQVGDQQVHVGVEEHSGRHSTKAHIAYAVSDLHSWRTVLASHGVEILDGVPIPGYERFEFRDPFGNRVEFIQAVENGSGHLPRL
jgi:catechol 2,3-dioxygenase-like lactoylglutathione lyase family enzyme